MQVYDVREKQPKPSDCRPQSPPSSSSEPKGEVCWNARNEKCANGRIRYKADKRWENNTSSPPGFNLNAQCQIRGVIGDAHNGSENASMRRLTDSRG
mmetsp:Transcript_36935/g.110636  ORF Transcript_36935/g.110636 Transcript_36935/m.110636 type:complete len:97 (+) Transcript_36935:902-1192(+)